MYTIETARLSGQKPKVKHIGIIYAFYRKMSSNIKLQREKIFIK